jgi:hypothetical protein
MLCVRVRRGSRKQKIQLGNGRFLIVYFMPCALIGSYDRMVGASSISAGCDWLASDDVDDFPIVLIGRSKHLVSTVRAKLKK